ncbi:MAG: hypothetical protein KGQ66_20880 [Acidobacteriota bacterium]|nr:hypothetical protein [Acidobacteriota bacterium]
MTGAQILTGLALTEVVEVPLYCLALKRVLLIRALVAAAAGASVNLISYPLFAWALTPSLVHPLGPEAALWCAEIMVWLLETALLYAWQRRAVIDLTLICLLANACSLLAGLLVG